MAETIKSSPLVSIVVITYNSSRYVLETLESIKSQTYKNIELVISDDCSTDETVAICQEWIDENQNAFSGALVISAKKNGGVPANCNQGLNNSHGQWVKLIAGDDILQQKCIESFLDAASRNPDASCFASDMYVMQGDVIRKKYSILRHRFPKNASKQLDNFIKYGPILGPALFFKTNALRQVGGYDERYRGFEDYPMYIKLTLGGYYFVVISSPLVLYREHAESITKSGSSLLSSSISEYMQSTLYPLAEERNLSMFIRHKKLHKHLSGADIKRTFILKLKIRFGDPYYWLWKLFSVFNISRHAQVRVVRVCNGNNGFFYKDEAILGKNP